MRKYLEIKEMMMRLIRSREFSGKIPGERVLADRFGYSYMTVRRAVCELTAEGFLKRKPRAGTFVSENTPSLRKSGKIGFYLYDGILNGVNSPYYSLLYSKLKNEINSRGYQIELCSCDCAENEIDGLIAASAPIPELESRICMVSRKIPVVLIDNDIKGTGFPSVVVDNFNSTYCAVEYAINLGHRDIGYVAGLQNSPVGIKRLGGFRAAMLDYNIPITEQYIYFGNYELNSGRAAAAHYLTLDRMPTFIHCANDCMAFGLSEGLQKAGLHIPEDVSICGFDNTETYGEGCPPMTTMAVNVDAMVKVCADMVLSEISGGKSTIRKYVVPAELLVRGSTSRPRKD